MTSPQAKPSATIAATPGRARNACSVCCRRLMKAADCSGEPSGLCEFAPTEPRSPMSGYAAERHRPGQGAQHLDYLEASGEKPHESSPRPVIEMPGRVTEVADVREARQVECPPQRLAWHARDQPGAGEAREHVERALGVLHVLEYL